MKTKKLAKRPSKLSFAVDREELEISSDWVQAVMADPGQGPKEANFFSPDVNTATGVRNTTDILIATDDFSATGSAMANDASVAQNTTVVSKARVWKLRPVRRITDGLTPGQYAVFSLMFEHGETAQEDFRCYRGGYADLGRLTGLSKRGIQNIIAELRDKGVIELQLAPGHHRTQTSVYRVPPAEKVVSVWHALGLRFAVGKSKRLIPGSV